MGDSQLVNKLNVPNDSLTIGDFNGDGTDDVFSSNASGFYVSYSTRTEWHKVLSPGAPLSSLRFGDFDGNGTEDVFRSDSGGVWRVSFSNRDGKDWSQWTELKKADVPIKDLTVGDFNGDGIDDVFRSDSGGWYVSTSGRGEWTRVNSGVPATSLHVANVSGDRRTDVVYFVPR
jgi:hypothetical protein